VSGGRRLSLRPIRALGRVPRAARERVDRLLAQPWMQLAAMVFFGGVAAVVLLGPVSETSGAVGPGSISMRARWASDGGTVVRLPPLGQLSASTHRIPVSIVSTVDRLDLEQLQDVLGRPNPGGALEASVTDQLGPLLRRLAVRTLLGSAVVGAIAAAVLARRRWRHVVAGGVGGVLAVAALLGGAWADFDLTAFDDPRFEGPLERAPAVIANARRHLDSFEQVSDRVDGISRQLADLYAAAARPLPDTGGEVRILHVSDIHSNPLGLEVAERLARNFDVAAVVDTGDLTSFGYPIEGQIGQLIAGLDVPYLLMPGNHDSDENRAQLAALPNVTVVHDEVVEIQGIRILGFADPTFTADNVLSRDEARAIKQQWTDAIGARVRRTEPDVLAVHDPVLSARALGQVPVVIAGHVHERRLERREGTILLTVGSTGATGLGSYTVETDLAYEAQLLRFVDGRLSTVDYVSLTGIGGNFVIDRRVVDQPDRVADPPGPRPQTPARQRPAPGAGR
jgi:predicted phosphodiesterase